MVIRESAVVKQVVSGEVNIEVGEGEVGEFFFCGSFGRNMAKQIKWMDLTGGRNLSLSAILIVTVLLFANWVRLSCLTDSWCWGISDVTEDVELPPLRYEDFTGQHETIWSLLDARQMKEVESYEKGEDRYPCHRVDLPTRQVRSNPIPSEWCEAAEGDGTLKSGEKPIYLFVIGAPFTGTSATAAVLSAAPNVTHLCQKRPGKEPQCEGWKLLVDEFSDLAKDRWDSNWSFPYDWQKNILQEYDSLWFDKTRLFRLDKSLPYAMQVGKMVEQLVDRDKERVAFLLMTRSSCSRDRDEGMDSSKFVTPYGFLLERGIPVLHIHYEDFFSNLDVVERRIEDWGKCLTADTMSGYLEIAKQVNGEEDKDSLERSRLQPLREYVRTKNLTDMQQRDQKLLKAEVESLVYFGYNMEQV